MDSSMNNAIQLNSRKQQLKTEYERLQKEYADVVEEREDLGAEGQKLEALYMDKVGHKQYDIMMLQQDIALLKRERDVLQAYINRGEKPDWGDVKITVEVTQADMNERLRREEERLEKAKEFVRKQMEEEEKQDAEKLELKERFKRLVHRLHPDLHPDQTGWEKNLFLKVQEAYAKKDLEMLRKLEAELEGGLPFSSVESFTEEEWEARVSGLKEMIANLRKEMELMVEKFPFTYRDRIYSPEWVAAKQEELSVQIAHLKEEKVRLKEIIKVMKGHWDGEPDSKD